MKSESLINEITARIFSELESVNALSNRTTTADKVKAVDLVTETVREALDMHHDMCVEEWMKDELSDMEMLYKHCSAAYMHLSRGNVSNPATRPEEVIALHDEVLDEFAEEIREEIRNEEKEEKDNAGALAWLKTHHPGVCQVLENEDQTHNAFAVAEAFGAREISK